MPRTPLAGPTPDQDRVNEGFIASGKRSDVSDSGDHDIALTVISGARTDVGLRREVNEDSIVVGPPVWAVADGMGGHAAGDVASRIVADALSGLIGLRSEELRPINVQEALKRANDRILAYTREHPKTRGMGSTVAGIVQVNLGDAPHWSIFNVGDSRVYRCFENKMSRVTVDHSEIEEMILSGEITEEEGRTHAGRNVITRSMGSDPAPVADLWVSPQTVGERFLICSDGLTTEVADHDIADILTTMEDPDRAAAALLDMTLEAGAHDNVSILVIDVLGGGSEVVEITQPSVRSPHGIG